jgi:hypothetical protein
VTTADELLQRLAAIAVQIEAHEAAVFMLHQERLALQAALRRSGWTPPAATSSSASGSKRTDSIREERQIVQFVPTPCGYQNTMTV